MDAFPKGERHDDEDDDAGVEHGADADRRHESSYCYGCENEDAAAACVFAAAETLQSTISAVDEDPEHGKDDHES